MLQDEIKKLGERIELLTAVKAIAEEFEAAVCILPGHDKACEDLQKHKIEYRASISREGAKVIVFTDPATTGIPSRDILRELLGEFCPEYNWDYKFALEHGEAWSLPGPRIVVGKWGEFRLLIFSSDRHD